MNKPVKILIIALVVVVGLNVLKNGIAQTILTSTLSKVAHVPVKIGSVKVSFLSATLRVKNLQMHNPSGFPGGLMVLVPQIFIDFEPGEFFHGRARFKEVRLDLKELNVVRDQKGRLNVDAVKPTEAQKRQADQKAKAPSGSQPPKLFIDKLYLSIGRVVYKDYSAGGEPVVQTFDIDIKDREFTNIDNPATVISLVMFEALTRTTLASLANLDINAFKEGGIQAVSKGLGLVSDSADAAEDTAKSLLNLLN